jgi:hypothetical protein
MLFAVSAGEFFLLVTCLLMVVVFPLIVAWLGSREENNS